jgi:hypothetical protein
LEAEITNFIGATLLVDGVAPMEYGLGMETTAKTRLTHAEIAASLRPAPRALARANAATGLSLTDLAYRGFHAIGGLAQNVAEGRPYTLAEYEEIGRAADHASEIAASYTPEERRIAERRARHGYGTP